MAQEAPPARLAPKGFSLRPPNGPGNLGRPDSREPGAPAPIGGFINCTQPLANCQDLITDNAFNSNEDNFICADDFRTVADGVITDVCWWGAYIPAPAANAFTVTFYLDIGGLPGPIVGGPFVEGFTLNNVTQRDTGLLVANIAPIFEYTASLGAPFAVSATVCYWIEIKNLTAAGNSWFWELANLANGLAVQDAGPNGYDPGDFVVADFAWCINLALGDSNTCPPFVPPACQPGANPLDCCFEREEIFNGKTEFSTEGATTDPDQPAAPAGCTGGPGPVNDIWYNYNATFTGNLRVTTCEDINGASTFDTVLVAYDGCDCAPLGPVLDCNDDDAGNPCGQGAPFQSTLVVPVVDGNCYKIRLGGFAGADAGTGVLDLTKEGPPEECQPGGVENNCCDARTPVFNGANEFSTVGATTDGSAHPECQFDGQTYHDIWFNYNSDHTGELVVSTCDRVDYDSDLVVYDGCDCPATNVLGCNDDAPGCAGFSSEVTVEVVAGNCYKIRVGGFQDGDQGSGSLNITKPEPINGDLCKSRRDLFNGKTEFSTEGTDTDGPGVPCTPIGPVNDIWFNYNADFTGDLQISTCEELNGSANFDTVLVVYDGCTCDPLDPILGCNDDDPNNPCGSGAGGFHSTVVVPVVSGNCYKVRLGGFSGGSSGTGVLDVTKLTDPFDCSAFACGNNDQKVFLCHSPPGNPDNEHTICIAAAAVPAHITEHPLDHCGPCTSNASAGSQPGMQVDVLSNRPEAFIDITQDIFGLGGDSGAFARYYPVGLTIILDAQKVVNGRAFLGWRVSPGSNGEPTPSSNWNWYGGTNLHLPMTDDGYSIEAIYTDVGGVPTPEPRDF